MSSSSRTSDKATFERRALAVEREGAIAENELQNQIELARRQEQLVAQNGANARRVGRGGRGRRRGPESAPRPAPRHSGSRKPRAAGIRLVGEAEGGGARRRGWRRTARCPRGCCSAWQLKELAGNLPNIEHLVADARPAHLAGRAVRAPGRELTS